jgi:tetratricopeptide (TPR) repeat protein
MTARHEPPSGDEPGFAPDPGLGDAGLARSAWEWRSVAPELARLLARRAIDQSPGQPGDSARGEALRMPVAEFVADCRLGHGLAGVPGACRLLEPVRAAGVTELEHALRLELAGCAAALGVPAAGIVALAGVLDEAQQSADRIIALLVLARCVPDAASAAAARDAISAAEELCHDHTTRDPASLGVSPDELTAAVSLTIARRARRSGELDAALHATETGLERLASGNAVTGAVRARLHLERVLDLLGLGSRTEACRYAEGPLAAPVRAAAAGPTSWLAIARARQVELPAMRFRHAEGYLREAACLARRHDLPSPAADAADGLAHVAERDGRAEEAVEHLREAQLMTRRRQAAGAGARAALVEAFGAASSDAFAASSEQLSRWLGGSRPRHGPSRSATELVGYGAVLPGGAAPRNGDAGAGDTAEPPEPSAPQGLAHLPGLVVTPGAGGRRRAPEPEAATETEGSGDSTPVDAAAIAGPDAAGGMGMGELLAEALLALRSGEAASRSGHRREAAESRPADEANARQQAGDETRSTWPRRPVDPDRDRY